MNKKETKQNEAKTEEKVAPPAPVAEEQVEAYAENFEKQRIGEGGQTACPQNL